jgi:lipopolysaccharide heptosyltransferase I
VLIVRPSALGDVCRTVPVLASLRKWRPEAMIDWVVNEANAGAVQAHPALDEAVAFPRGRFGSWWRNPMIALQVRRWLKDLRTRHYDLVIDCQCLGRSGAIAWATRAPRRVGFAGAREFAWLGYNVRHPLPDVHTVDQMLSLLEAEGIEPVRDMTLYVSSDDRSWWRQRREEYGLSGQRYAVLAPTARWASKRWPIEHWRELAVMLLERGFERIIVAGAPGEESQVASLVPRSPVAREAMIDLVGRSSVGQTMAMIAMAELVVANDSAPLHMAVGLGRRCLGLYGPTDPAFVGPYRQPQSVIRAYQPKTGESLDYKNPKLGDRLMRMITPAMVIDRIDSLLRRRSEPDAFADRRLMPDARAQVRRRLFEPAPPDAREATTHAGNSNGPPR